jgi:dTDP-4-amino-4,6-dideoxygalactose transaminase
MKVAYLDLPRQFQDEGLFEEMKKVFSRGQFILGSEVEKFEDAFAKLCGTNFALGLNSGTDALFLALKALGIGPGDEVLTVPNSFVATAGAIMAVGAKPVFVDVAPDYNIDVTLIESSITPRSKAIIPVHLTGNPADMPGIAALAKRHNLYIIEDAAQSVMAAINGQPTGSFGEAGCFSLHPLKNLNAGGDGGVLTTNSEDLYRKIKMLRNHGLKNRDEIEFFGYNSRLDAIQAVIALHGLKKLKEVTQKRIANAALYDREIKVLENFVTVPPRRSGWEQVFHTYVVQVKDRERLIAFLEKEGVETKIHYPIPIHLQKPCRLLGYRKGDFPVCESQSEKILTLPIHQFLTPEQLFYVTKQIKEFYGKN